MIRRYTLRTYVRTVQLDLVRAVLVGCGITMVHTYCTMYIVRTTYIHTYIVWLLLLFIIIITVHSVQCTVRIHQ